jgi:hypothetical protein
MFSSAWENFFCTKLTSDSDSEHSKTSKNGLNWFFPQLFGDHQILSPKKSFYCCCAPPLCQFLATCYVRTTTMTTYKTRCGGLAWGWHCKRAMSARLFFIVSQIIMHCHRFTLNGSFCMLIYARTCNIFVILTPRSNSGIKKELIAHFLVFLTNYYGVPPNFGGQKIKILLLWVIRSCQSFFFTLKGSISAVSDLLGHFFQCQNQITKTGGLWLSATVGR